jgi:hypothetical protein
MWKFCLAGITKTKESMNVLNKFIALETWNLLARRASSKMTLPCLETARPRLLNSKELKDIIFKKQV